MQLQMLSLEEDFPCWAAVMGAVAGNSIFFTVRRIEDPIGLLPAKVILGINKRGVHFFRPVPKEYIHSAELRDIMQFGSSSQAVFFKMRVAGVLHIFQFETRQGEDICMALQTHINDIMMKRYSKVVPPAGTLSAVSMTTGACLLQHAALQSEPIYLMLCTGMASCLVAESTAFHTQLNSSLCLGTALRLSMAGLCFELTDVLHISSPVLPWSR